MNAGLRIDVDTFRGTKTGVPTLCRILAEHRIQATFFFSVGPDNMGRHLWRLFRPSFLAKMRRSRAASLYGWQILFQGTFWPGRRIGRNLAPAIRAASESGHEIGLHAWDHRAWQAHIDRMDLRQIGTDLQRGYDELRSITGSAPPSSAVAGWKCNDLVLLEKAAFPFLYNSDCRGESVFVPLVNGSEMSQPQIPVTLPTYDEVIGRHGVTDSTYNNHLLSLMRSDRLNVLTIHAEVEGDSRRGLFAAFLREARKRTVSFAPLRALLSRTAALPRCEIEPREIPGRDGWVACQKLPKSPDGSRS